MNERPLCELCEKIGGITVIHGKILCGVCFREYIDRLESMNKELFADIKDKRC